MMAVRGAILYGLVMISPIWPCLAYLTLGPEEPPAASAVPAASVIAAMTPAATVVRMKDMILSLVDYR